MEHNPSNGHLTSATAASRPALFHRRIKGRIMLYDSVCSVRHPEHKVRVYRDTMHSRCPNSAFARRGHAQDTGRTRAATLLHHQRPPAVVDSGHWRLPSTRFVAIVL